MKSLQSLAPAALAAILGGCEPTPTDEMEGEVAAAGAPLLRRTVNAAPRCPLAAPRTLATVQPAPTAVAADASGIFWINGNGGDRQGVMRLPRAGGTVDKLAEVRWLGDAVSYDLALDATTVYFTDGGEGGPSGWPGAIQTVPRAGGATVDLAPGERHPIALLHDGRHVYWIENDEGAGAVRRVDQAGGAPELLATVGNPVRARIAVGGSSVFVTLPEERKLLRIPKQGGTATVVFDRFGGRPGPLAVDATHAFVADDGAGVVWSIDTARGTGRRLFHTTRRGIQDDLIHDLAADETYLYWASESSADYTSRHIVRARKDGTGFCVAADQTATSIAVDAAGVVYATPDAEILTIDK